MLPRSPPPHTSLAPPTYLVAFPAESTSVLLLAASLHTFTMASTSPSHRCLLASGVTTLPLRSGAQCGMAAPGMAASRSLYS
jgi:hypothetical protein